MINKIKLSTDLISKEDFVAVRFEIAGNDFYHIIKNRYGDNGVISELPNLTGLKSARIINFQDLEKVDRDNFIQSLIETIA